MDLSIFESFPSAIVYGEWQLGNFKHGSVVGNVFNKCATLDVIVDEGNSSEITSTPERAVSDYLIYAQPSQLPTLRTTELVGGYMLYNDPEDKYYAIIDAGIGKNQENGNIEHVELKVVQTEADNNGDDCFC